MKYVLAVLIIFLFIGACKKNTCEGFPESQLKWTPFEVNEKIKYSDNTDTLELTVTDKFYSKESKYSGEPFPDFCSPESSYETNEVDNISIYEKVELNYGNVFITTNFSSSNIFFYELRDGYYSDSISVRHIGDTLINGIQLNEAYKIVKDSQNGIDWFIKAANRGIISFGDNNSNKIWEQMQ